MAKKHAEIEGVFAEKTEGILHGGQTGKPPCGKQEKTPCEREGGLPCFQAGKGEGE